MTPTTRPENAHAGQGPVLLDIGGDVGALIVTMPATMEGAEVEIRPHTSRPNGAADDHDLHGPDNGHHVEHSHAATHHRHVAVVNRPVQDGRVASLVYPELIEGRYELYLKGTDHVRLTVDVHGGEVATTTWPTQTVAIRD